MSGQLPKTPVALTVAGSDPSGGAGVQVDLKVFHQHGVYGAAAISLLTVQNTRGVTRVAVQPPDLVAEQIDAVAIDLPVGAVKTGALGNAGVIGQVAAKLSVLSAPVVVDPVMVAKGGASLLDDDAALAMRESLLPCAALVTPNLEEAEALLGYPVRTLEARREAARALVDLGAGAALVKGGHGDGTAVVDILYAAGQFHEFTAERIETRHTHGTGCALSAAICARLARGEDLASACASACAWVQRAIATAPRLGAGHGPTNTFAPVLQS